MNIYYYCLKTENNCKKHMYQWKPHISYQNQNKKYTHGNLKNMIKIILTKIINEISKINNNDSIRKKYC